MPFVSSNAAESESAEEPSRSNAARSEERRGVALAFAAFLIWGLFPIYFDLLRDVRFYKRFALAARSVARQGPGDSRDVAPSEIRRRFGDHDGGDRGELGPFHLAYRG